jgi:hypothetical protein
MVGLLGLYLTQQHERGRSPATVPLRGLAIEDGEAEGLVHELALDLAQPARIRPTPDPSVDARACSGPPVDAAPLRHAARVFHLQPFEYDALVLALAVELDQRFARLIAYLNDHVARTRPTVGLALALTDTDANPVDLCQASAIRQGLLVLDGDGPLSERSLRVAPELLALLVSPTTMPGPPGLTLLPSDSRRLEDLVIDAAQREYLRRWAGAVWSGVDKRPLVVAGRPGSGRATAARAAAASAGRSTVTVTLSPEPADHAEQLGSAARVAVWHQALLLICADAGGAIGSLPGFWAAHAGWDLPLAVTVPAELVEALCAAAPVEPAVVRLQEPTARQREALWRWLLPSQGSSPPVELSDADITELAARYDVLPGTILRAVRRTVADSVLAGLGAHLDLASLSSACRAIGAASMGPIAHRLAQPYTRDDLVLPQDLLDELDLARAWMRRRRLVFEDWGFGGRIALGRGLTALFAGGPGTGKTMAAQVLARELGLELFRVDLSQIVSKYIGDTEKQLSQLFDEARASGAILFFDEADTLFGKRTEVRDAHDRYANLEVGYLLQRMEEHTGTTVLATNRAGDLDEAFTRRFHFILDFPMPRSVERRRIWEGMFPRDAPRDADIDFDTIARDYEVSGGEIRNSVLSAAFIAADEGVPMGLRHLKRGLRRELLKTGRVLDSRQRLALEGD